MNSAHVAGSEAFVLIRAACIATVIAATLVTSAIAESQTASHRIRVVDAPVARSSPQTNLVEVVAGIQFADGS